MRLSQTVLWIGICLSFVLFNGSNAFAGPCEDALADAKQDADIAMYSCAAECKETYTACEDFCQGLYSSLIPLCESKCESDGKTCVGFCRRVRHGALKNAKKDYEMCLETDVCVDGTTYDKDLDACCPDAIWIADCWCEPGQEMNGFTEYDDNGCTLGYGCECVGEPCLPILCMEGYVPVDTDNDGCDDECMMPQCMSDQDCGDGEVCSVSNGDCQACMDCPMCDVCCGVCVAKKKCDEGTSYDEELDACCPDSIYIADCLCPEGTDYKEVPDYAPNGCLLGYGCECVAACSAPGACGGGLGMPNYECPDGKTIAGPGDCVLKPDGVCGWEIIECPDGCTQDGMWYGVGENWLAKDGCNQCTCTENGDIACTEMFCPDVCEGGQVWNDCGSACTATCDDPTPMCTMQCVPKCECPNDMPLWDGEKCIKESDCGACPDGSDPVLCIVAPCEFAECPAYPDAECVDNYCDGCFADFYVDGKMVDCAMDTMECEVDEDCPDTHWCRPTATSNSVPVECVPYVGEDDSCGGFVPYYMLEKCDPSLVCTDMNPLIMDEPGVCLPPSNVGCEYGGMEYEQGDSFDGVGDDWCNSCFCGAGGEVACTKMFCGPQPCTEDSDCAPTHWCRDAEDFNGKECVPYVGIGDSCGGFTLPWYYEKCEPGIICEQTNPMIPDLPGICTDPNGPTGCEYGGMWYEVGDSFSGVGDDWCNSCFCGEDGAVGCTKMLCPPQGCEYGGNMYAPGDSFPGVGSDWCNTCFCDEGGQVACTEMACGPEPCPDGSDPVQCFVEPCSVSECDAHPNAQCMNDYCGGCFAIWMVDGEEVDCNPVDMCEDFVPPCNEDKECGEGQVCSFEGCNPSTCGCDPATGEVMCTADCGGGVCVDDKPVDCEPGTVSVAADLCNTCICGVNGSQNCTKKGCSDPCDDSVCWSFMDQCQVSGTSSASGSCDDAFMNCMYAVAEQCDAPPQECIVSGCSGQVCAAQEVMTTCEWLPEYACYQDLGECGNFGPGGACTWNPTPALEQCLDNASGGGEPDSNGALD